MTPLVNISPKPGGAASSLFIPLGAARNGVLYSTRSVLRLKIGFFKLITGIRESLRFPFGHIGSKCMLLKHSARLSAMTSYQSGEAQTKLTTGTPQVR